MRRGFRASSASWRSFPAHVRRFPGGEINVLHCHRRPEAPCDSPGTPRAVPPARALLPVGHLARLLEVRSPERGGAVISRWAGIYLTYGALFCWLHLRCAARGPRAHYSRGPRPHHPRPRPLAATGVGSVDHSPPTVRAATPRCIATPRLRRRPRPARTRYPTHHTKPPHGLAPRGTRPTRWTSSPRPPTTRTASAQGRTPPPPTPSRSRSGTAPRRRWHAGRRRARSPTGTPTGPSPPSAHRRETTPRPDDLHRQRAPPERPGSPRTRPRRAGTTPPTLPAASRRPPELGAVEPCVLVGQQNRRGPRRPVAHPAASATARRVPLVGKQDAVRVPAGAPHSRPGGLQKVVVHCSPPVAARAAATRSAHGPPGSHRISHSAGRARYHSPSATVRVASVSCPNCSTAYTPRSSITVAATRRRNSAASGTYRINAGAVMPMRAAMPRMVGCSPPRTMSTPVSRISAVRRSRSRCMRVRPSGSSPRDLLIATSHPPVGEVGEVGDPARGEEPVQVGLDVLQERLVGGAERGLERHQLAAAGPPGAAAAQVTVDPVRPLHDDTPGPGTASTTSDRTPVYAVTIAASSRVMTEPPCWSCRPHPCTCTRRPARTPSPARRARSSGSRTGCPTPPRCRCRC